MGTYSADIVIKETGAGEAAADIKKLGDNSGEAGGKVEGLKQTTEGLQSVFAALGIGFTVSEFVKMADAATSLQNRLSLVSQGLGDMAGVTSRLSGISEKYAQSIDGLGAMYVSLSQATKGLNINQNELLNVTESMAAIMHSSGRSADEVSGTMQRLAAGMAEGVISGRNFSSMFIQVPEIAQAVAKGMGVSTQMLFALGNAGTLTAKTVLDALQKMKGEAEAQAATMKGTFSDAWVRAQGTISDAVASINKATTGTSLLGEALAISAEGVRGWAIMIEAASTKATQLGVGLDGLRTKWDNASNAAARWMSGISAGDAAATQAATRVRAFSDQLNVLATAANNSDLKLGQAQQMVRQLTQAYAQGGPAMDGVIQRQTKLMQSQQGVVAAVNEGILSQRTGAQAVAALSAAYQQGGQQLDQTVVKVQTIVEELSKLQAALDAGTISTDAAAKKYKELTDALNDTQKAAAQHIETMTRTKSTVDQFGNTVRTTTESIKGENGAITDLKQTIDKLDNGVHTVTVSVRDSDGAWHQLSSTVEAATQRITSNTGALGQNAAALNQVASAANAASAAESRVGSGGGGGGGGSPSAYDQALGAFQDSSMTGGSKGGMFTPPPGFEYITAGLNPSGQTNIQLVPTTQTTTAYSDFNKQVGLLTQELAAATGNQNFTGMPFNPYTLIPHKQSVGENGASPVGTIPSLGELLDHVRLLDGLNFSANGPAASGSVAGASSGSPFSITTPTTTGTPGVQTFAGGGEFDVGGQGGTDSQYVNFMASPDEHVSITTPSQRDAGAKGSAAGATQVFMTVNARDAASFGRNQTQIMQMLNQGIARAQSQLQRRGR